MPPLPALSDPEDDEYAASPSAAQQSDPLLWAFLTLMFLAPIPLGSNLPWASHLLELGIFVLVALWTLRHILRGQPFLRNVNRLSLVFGLFLTWATLPMVQILPLGAHSVLHADAVVELIRFTHPQATHFPVSLDVHATMEAFFRNLAYLGASWLVLVLINTRDNLRLAVTALFASGVFQGLYGFFSSLGGAHLLPLLPAWDPLEGGTVVGTYVNRNHLAGLLELTIPLGLAMAVTLARSNRSRRESEIPRWPQNLNQLLGRYGLFLVLSMFSTLVMLLTRSRGAALAFGCSLVVLWFLTFFKEYPSDRERRVLNRLLVFALAGGILSAGVFLLVERFHQSAIAADMRAAVLPQTLEKVLHYPLLGTGAGTFGSTFPPYRTETITKRVTHAHNDHLEFMADYGVLGYLLLMLPVLVSWGILLRRFLQRRDPLARGVLMGSLMGSFALALHGMVDFNLQIPANALYFFVVLFLGLVSADIATTRRSRRRHRLDGTDESDAT
ncbi:MAG: O-antigen ligase family protein [Magnetococcus sp. WYHC-3]